MSVTENDYIQTFEERYRNGKLYYKGTRKGNKLHGSLEVWYINGVLKEYSEFSNNVNHGSCLEWDCKGNLIKEEYYLYGNRVSEEEYLKHKLIERLSGVKDGS